MANETGLDFTEQIITLENKYRQIFTRISLQYNV
ncbi:unnamed protein product [Arabidopsis halleri]